jgi:hypothetical protein
LSSAAGFAVAQQAQCDRWHAHQDPEPLDQCRGQVEILTEAEQNQGGCADIADKIQAVAGMQDL